MSDSKFILVGTLVRMEDYYGESSTGEPAGMKSANNKNGSPEDERLYAMFVLITDDPEKGGVHEVVAIPSAANSAYHCIQKGVPGVVMGNIRSFDRKPMLIATYITSLEPSNYMTREFFPEVKDWRLSKLPEFAKTT
jgi:hypothetical protein